MVISDTGNHINEAKSQEKMVKPKSIPARLPLGRQGDPSVSESIARALWDTPSTSAALVGGVLTVGASVLTVGVSVLTCVSSGFILMSEATVPMHTAHFTAGQQAIDVEYDEEDDLVFIFHPETQLRPPYDGNDVD